jgi:hypothetical protein
LFSARFPAEHSVLLAAKGAAASTTDLLLTLHAF